MDSLAVKLRLIGSIYPQMLEALGVTLTIAALALPLAVALGAVIAALRLFGIAHRVFDHRLQIAVDRLLQFLHQLFDFGVGRVLGERVLQTLLDRAQFALGRRQAPVFDAQGDVPQQILHFVDDRRCRVLGDQALLVPLDLLVERVRPRFVGLRRGREGAARADRVRGEEHQACGDARRVRHRADRARPALVHPDLQAACERGVGVEHAQRLQAGQARGFRDEGRGGGGHGAGRFLRQ